MQETGLKESNYVILLFLSKYDLGLSDQMILSVLGRVTWLSTAVDEIYKLRYTVLNSVATPKVFSPDLGFSDPI